MDQTKIPSVSARSNAPDQKIHALTSARFFAALFVVIYHTKWGIPAGSIFGKTLELGYIAPYFFFLLSGYILAVVYMKKTFAVAKRRFFIARFARIYPLFIVTALFDFPFAVLARAAKYGFGVATLRVIPLFSPSIFMLQMWLPTPLIVNGPSWSLSIETVFYLSFPFLAPVLWRLTGRQSLLASLVLYVGSTALEVLVIRRFGDIKGHPTAFHLVSFEAVFVCGILLARWQSASIMGGSSGTISSPLAWSITLLGTIGFFACVHYYPLLSARQIDVAYVLVPVYMAAIWVLSTSNIIAVKILSHPWLVILGEASYGLYLIHDPMRHLFDNLHLSGSLLNYPLYLASSIGLSVLSFFFFETPCRKYILRRFHTGTKETREAASAAQ